MTEPTSRRGRARSRTGRLSRAETTALLAGAGASPVRDLLTAASGPARRVELGGEGAALAAFAATTTTTTEPAAVDTPVGVTTAAPAGTTGTAPPGGTAGSPARPPRLRGPARLVAVLALGLATAGVATAAVATLHGGLPAPTASAPARLGPPPPSTEPAELCRAWRTDPLRDEGVRVRDPAYVPLLDAAGGPGEVAGYCATVAAVPGGPDALGPTVPAGSLGAPSATPPLPTTSGAARTTGPSSGSGVGSGSADSGSAGSGSGSAGTGSAGSAAAGRSVGPPATPPGQAASKGPGSKGSGSENSGRGRAVGPPATPPGRASRGASSSRAGS